MMKSTVCRFLFGLKNRVTLDTSLSVVLLFLYVPSASQASESGSLSSEGKSVSVKETVLTSPAEPAWPPREGRMKTRASRIDFYNCHPSRKMTVWKKDISNTLPGPNSSQSGSPKVIAGSVKAHGSRSGADCDEHKPLTIVLETEHRYQIDVGYGAKRVEDWIVIRGDSGEGATSYVYR